MKKILDWFINLYAVWIVLSFIIGFYFPKAFLWFTTGHWMTAAMAIVMLGMGLTLNISDFREIVKMPKTIMLAAICQYTVMPLLGWSIAKIMQLPVEFAVGLILLSCCPGGTASNLIAYIGRANVALSILMTAFSTVLAIVMTPLLSKFLAGQMVPVDALGMLLNVIEVVLIPVAAGVLINYYFPVFVKRLGQTGPFVSTWAIVFISGGIIAPAVTEGKDILLANLPLILGATFCLHSIAFILGYLFAKLCGYNNKIARTVSIETGMQNGGLAAVLAKNNFQSLMPLVSVPAVFGSVIQTVIGGIMATYWRFTNKE